ncbi:MAG TPA: glycosyl hydrolase [Terriglobales bacterium]|nr:glycosyl hydrolase [Terriglobales bacterium]
MFVLFIFALIIGCGATHKTGTTTTTSPSSPQTPTPTPIPTPVSPTAVSAEYFGMHVHDISNWPSVSFGSLRLWDAGVTWPSLEPAPGQWNFVNLDAIISKCAQNNVDVSMVLGLSPQWASARPTEPSAYQPGNAAEPGNIQDWRDFVQAVATRYKGRIHNYEIWNEPNDPTFFSGTPAKMLELATEAYKILKQVDPSVTVLSPAATEQGGLSWLDQYLGIGGGNVADVIAYHLYVHPNPPENMLALLTQVKAIMAQHSQSSKPVWDTETGWHSPSTFTQADEASFVVRSYLLAGSAGVSRFYWYAWDDRDWVTLQLTNTDGSLRPSAQAFAIVRGWMLNSSPPQCSSDSSGTWTCALTQASVTSHVVWNQNGTATFAVPQGWNPALMIDDLGQHTILSPGSATLQISTAPVWLGAGS